MSQEFENQIRESVLNDRIKFLWKNYRLTILISVIFIIATFIIYFSYEIFNKKKYSQELYEYSAALDKLNKKNLNESKQLLKKLISSNNSNIVLLSLNQLLTISTNSKKEMLEYINLVLNEKKLKNENLELLQIKKTLILFDDLDENSILELLNTKSKTSHFLKINNQLLHDFYIGKNQIDKAELYKKIK